MIQRIQSIYLFLAAILMAVSIFVPLVDLYIDQNTITLFAKGMILDGDLIKLTWGILLFSIVSGLFPFISIFLYKKRKAQMKLIRISILSVILWYVTVFVYLLSYSPDLASNLYHIFLGVILPLLAIILEIIAFFKVKKDDKLVKSLDRIR